VIIAHLTSVHTRYDTRIFIKMCKSLVLNGYNVLLVVADGKGDEVKDGVSIVDVGATTGGRLSRMTKTCSRVFKKAKELDGDVYHIHDPELIPAGLKLKKLGKKIIFDSHEDFPNQILNKTYLSYFSKKIFRLLATIYLNWSISKFDAVISSTSYIDNQFIKKNLNSYNIKNSPIIDELYSKNCLVKKKKEICYIGMITEARGIKEILLSLDYTPNIRLNLAGNFNDEKLKNKIKKLPQWSKVNELGFVNRDQVKEVLQRSIAGLMVLHSNNAYINSVPIKLFEYMVGGLPVICSNFPLWKEIVEKNYCGICVDPKDPQSIGRAVQFIINNPSEVQLMIENGQKLVKSQFNWAIEEKKLIDIYEQILI
jgi:glycosyltransferase involved in cell wall biosynthesis